MHLRSHALRATIVVALAGCARAAMSPLSAPPDTLILDHATVLDVASDTALIDRAVVIRGGRVIAIEAAGAVVRERARRVDLQGRWVLPGLWDMHVHTLSAGTADRVQPQLRRMLGYGILGVRDLGSYVDSSRALLPLLRADTLVPGIAWVGPLLDGAKFQWSQHVAWHITTPDAAAKSVDSLGALGVSGLKVYGSLNAREFDAVMARARDRGLWVSGHLPRGISATRAAQAGMRSIEHAGLDLVMWCAADGPARVGRVLDRWVREGYTGRYAEMDALWSARDPAQCAAQNRALATSGTFVTPTLVLELKDSTTLQSPALSALDSLGRQYCTGTVASIMQAPPAMRERVFAALLADVREMHAAGVRLLAGTDLGNPCIVPGASLHDELAWLARAGLPPIEVLRTGTVHAAQAMSLDSELGAVRTGFRADFVVVSSDPRAARGGLAQLRTPAGVVRAGRWVDSVSLAGMR
jgi:Amidohydrolase family